MGGLPHRFQTIQKFAGWPESSPGRSQWSTLDISRRRRRVVAKSEWTQGEANPRFVVTSLKRSEAGARQLYEDIHCARGDKIAASAFGATVLVASCRSTNTRRKSIGPVRNAGQGLAAFDGVGGKIGGI